jgi:ABC-type Fe3+-hydroxamate transport system substrate-binding protein
MATVRIRDDLGRDVILVHPPHRVVSLVPSDTYTLFALGAGDRVVGRTRYCDAPAGAAAAPEVGGTKDVDVAAVLALAPDLVIANQEENPRAPLEHLAARVPLLVSLPRRAADGVAHVARLARALRIEREPAVVGLVRRGYDVIRAAETHAGEPVPVFAPIWMEPLMTVNGDTFGHDVLGLAGARNVFGDRLRLYPLAADLGKAPPTAAGDRDVRYPRVDPSEIVARGARAVVVPDEPRAFTDAEVATFAAGLPVVRVSGKDLFWYGAWTIDALPRLTAAIDGVRQTLAR